MKLPTYVLLRFCTFEVAAVLRSDAEVPIRHPLELVIFVRAGYVRRHVRVLSCFRELKQTEKKGFVKFKKTVRISSKNGAVVDVCIPAS